MRDRFYAARDVLGAAIVRVRITRRCPDEIEGVSLGHLEVGLVYQVSVSLGSYLVAVGCAEAVLDAEVNQRLVEQQQFSSNMKRWREMAQEVTRARRRKR